MTLRVLKEIVGRNGVVTGYRINELKGNIFGINVKEDMKKEIFGCEYYPDPD